jgi:hypothetical protein
MSNHIDQLRDLKVKIEKLINLQQQLIIQNTHLQAVNNQLTQKSQRQDEQIAELENQNKVIRIAQKLSGSDQNSREMKLKINEYIREIDKCLGLINR